MVGLGLSNRNSGLVPDRKIWQSAHLCHASNAVPSCKRHIWNN